MDLPNELRRIADIELTGYSEEMMRQAADEIERLREALRGIAEGDGDFKGDPGPWARIATRALGQSTQ